MPRRWAFVRWLTSLPVIEEVLEMRVSPDYFQHVRRKLQRIAHLR